MTFETIRAMLIGYARVSTQEQTLDLQKDALENIGCIKIFSDVVSGAKAERSGLTEALEYVREGDTLVVWRLDRLGRSLKHLIETITKLNNRKIGFKSITENIDTTTSGGKLVFHIPIDASRVARRFRYGAPFAIGDLELKKYSTPT